MAEQIVCLAVAGSPQLHQVAADVTLVRRRREQRGVEVLEQHALRQRGVLHEPRDADVGFLHDLAHDEGGAFRDGRAVRPEQGQQRRVAAGNEGQHGVAGLTAGGVDARHQHVVEDGDHGHHDQRAAGACSRCTAPRTSVGVQQAQQVAHHGLLHDPLLVHGLVLGVGACGPAGVRHQVPHQLARPEHDAVVLVLHGTLDGREALAQLEELLVRLLGSHQAAQALQHDHQDGGRHGLLAGHRRKLAQQRVHGRHHQALLCVVRQAVRGNIGAQLLGGLDEGLVVRAMERGACFDDGVESLEQHHLDAGIGLQIRRQKAQALLRRRRAHGDGLVAGVAGCIQQRPEQLVAVAAHVHAASGVAVLHRELLWLVPVSHKGENGVHRARGDDLVGLEITLHQRNFGDDEPAVDRRGVASRHLQHVVLPELCMRLISVVPTHVTVFSLGHTRVGHNVAEAQLCECRAHEAEKLRAFRGGKHTRAANGVEHEGRWVVVHHLHFADVLEQVCRYGFHGRCVVHNAVRCGTKHTLQLQARARDLHGYEGLQRLRQRAKPGQRVQQARAIGAGELDLVVLAAILCTHGTATGTSSATASRMRGAQRGGHTP